MASSSVARSGLGEGLDLSNLSYTAFVKCKSGLLDESGKLAMTSFKFVIFLSGIKLGLEPGVSVTFVGRQPRQLGMFLVTRDQKRSQLTTWKFSGTLTYFWDLFSVKLLVAARW